MYNKLEYYTAIHFTLKIIIIVVRFFQARLRKNKSTCKCTTVWYSQREWIQRANFLIYLVQVCCRNYVVYNIWFSLPVVYIGHWVSQDQCSWVGLHYKFWLISYECKQFPGQSIYFPMWSFLSFWNNNVRCLLMRR